MKNYRYESDNVKINYYQEYYIFVIISKSSHMHLTSFDKTLTNHYANIFNRASYKALTICF